MGCLLKFSPFAHKSLCKWEVCTVKVLLSEKPECKSVFIPGISELMNSEYETITYFVHSV